MADPSSDVDARLEDALAELTRLRHENAQLQNELEKAKETTTTKEKAATASASQQTTIALSTDQKVALFRELFKGRQDIYPLRWENKSGKSGYSPACGNEWKAGICEKPRIKCSDCPHQKFLAVNDKLIFDHLSGRCTAGVYPLLEDDTCYFLAADFDDAEWRADVTAFAATCDATSIPVSIEISRSGKGAHAWLFFSQPIPAAQARALGAALVSRTCAQTRQLKLSSYDRFFPSQDTLPKGGFGNLIALPLQKVPRQQDCSVFVDRSLVPHADQWAYLATAQHIAPADLARALDALGAHTNPLDVSFQMDTEVDEPWRPRPSSPRLPAPLPKALTITLANQLYFEKAELPNALANRLVRLAAFPNPDFYATQVMRFSVWDKPRVIGCAENFEKHIAIPRGCLDDALALLAVNDIKATLRDERMTGTPLSITFNGALRPEQEAAARAMLAHDIGILSAPTAFGKTITAAAIIAKRGVSTLILVHRTELLTQWYERLRSLLNLAGDEIGLVGAGKHKPKGKIDVAVMQSLVRNGEVKELVEAYGQVIVDECHHVSAVSFEKILKRVKGRFVLGLTATPARRDGHEPIVTMQCGPIRHRARNTVAERAILQVLPRFHNSFADSGGEQIQALFNRLCVDDHRNRLIAKDILDCHQRGRHIVVLTERTEHVELLAELLKDSAPSLFVLHGRMGKRQRRDVLDCLGAMAHSAPRILLATGKLLGEGFDHARLDTLILAMPISWKGTLQQYAGRLHRNPESKDSILIYDYVDAALPKLMRMWEKRKRGYRAMGYEIKDSGNTQPDLLNAAEAEARSVATD
ncbi:MAG: TOTE conflict system archaeo-eukaryotic primase domain-containing protein [Stenotrophobium sp.]